MLFRSIFWLLCFGFSYQNFAQESSLSAVDSLEQQLNSTTEKSRRAYLLMDIARSATGVDSTKAYQSAKSGLAYFQQVNDSIGLAKAYSTMGFVVFDYHNMEQSERYYEIAKRLFEIQMKKDSSRAIVNLWADTVLNLAASIGNQGRHDEEITYLTELAPIVKSIKNYKILAIINSNLGIIFFNNKDLKKAYFYFNGNHEFYEQTKSYSQYATDRLVFSSCLMEMDSLKQAKEQLERAHNVLKKTPDSPRWHLYHQQLGEYYSKKGMFKQALNEYDASVKIINQSKFYGALAQQYLQYVETYLKMNNTKKAKLYLVKFYEYSSVNNPPDALYALKELIKLENKSKNYKSAASYANLYLKINDSVKLDEIEKETSRLEQLYQKEKKDREILELNNINNAKDLELERKKTQNYLLYFLLGSLSFITILVYLTYHNRQKKALLKQEIQEREIQQLTNDKERTLFGVMMEGAEQERKRLAIDLHDGLGGRLSGISIKLSKLSEDKKFRQTTLNIDDILDNMNGSLQELRVVARNLMPETLLKYGLKAALEDYCSTLKDKDTNILLQYYSNKSIDDNHKNLMLYRIIQELINNAVKHAKANEILVQFMHNEGKIDITVDDDGIGFNENLKEHRGMGFINLNSRVSYLNGHMDVRSIMKEGTSVNIQIEL